MLQQTADVPPEPAEPVQTSRTGFTDADIKTIENDIMNYLHTTRPSVFYACFRELRDDPEVVRPFVNDVVTAVLRPEQGASLRAKWKESDIPFLQRNMFWPCDYEGLWNWTRDQVFAHELLAGS